MIIDFIINIAYLIGALAFVWGLRLLSSPDTARREYRCRCGHGYRYHCRYRSADRRGFQ